MNMASETWIDIGPLADIPREGGRVVRTVAGCVAVFRTANDEVYATDDRCPHKGGPLSEGIVHGRQVTCPLHNRVFDMATGEAQGADRDRVATFAARLDGGRVLLNAGDLLGRAPAVSQ